MNDTIAANLIQVTILDIAIIVLYFCGLLFLSQRLKRKNDKYFYLFIMIGVAHLVMTFVYYFYTLSSVADAIGYFRKVTYHTTTWLDTVREGVQGVNIINFLLYPLVKIIKLTYFGSYFVFSFLGLLGFYLIFNVMADISKNKFITSFYILLLPNAHFWTVGIGKDSLIFYAISHIAYNFYFKKPVIKYIVPCLLVGLIRLHTLVFILAALALTQMFFNKRLSIALKTIVASVASALTFLLFPLIMERVGVKEGMTISERYENLEGLNMTGSSSLDMQGSSIFIKLPSYLFRPAVFEIKNLLTFVAAIENLMLLYVFYLIIKYRKNVKSVWVNFIFLYCIISIFLVVTPSAMILTNLGIAMRQKYMAFPFIAIAYIIAALKKRQLQMLHN